MKNKGGVEKKKWKTRLVDRHIRPIRFLFIGLVQIPWKNSSCFFAPLF